ncbi:type II secretion system F family protein [Moritella viscosa]|uniref:Flp pilus assembly protein TadB n=1 Tax=Moritella viscosa TaxID=80854 RepID=A0A1K9ZN20_9GAMM|nr:type II secretion system F family protein [Moritella viscosa]SGY90808.1 Flp pilus assembly protein TadB [Moritella viscosa]SGY99746.1 Flp pilus assembly protein TadB [Moritella viscosa]SGZ00369.1 Flp pilus assembly protein TadB [Moritella viscosa]SHO05967.1 Flp pilus assembly protein TadB [Moritella viscosa]SHO05997.1 Flp pilus assembly protein TadB [Moritella viscosa]
MNILLIFMPLLAVLLYMWCKRKKNHNLIEVYLSEFNVKEFTGPKTTIMNMAAFSKLSVFDKIKNFVTDSILLIGDNVVLKLGLFYATTYILSIVLNTYLLQANITIIVIVIAICATFFMLKILQNKRENEFKDGFPDALNLLISAVSAGDSITHAIDFVGKKLDNVVGHEFKRISERLLIGEPPEQVLKKSCQMFPYTEYFFFVVTLRANMNRGGQLKEILQRINRIMFESYAINKKKFALTSESRASAKIVSAIPVIFIVILKFISPENFDFVMYEEAGKPILYYVVISEFIGLGIIRMLMKSVG